MNTVEAFEGRVVAVTGGARGQGLSHACAFASRGAQVVVLDSTTCGRGSVPYELAQVKDFAEASKALGAVTDKFVIMDVDVTDRNVVKSAFEQVDDRFGRIDVLVNNAGVNSLRSLGELDEAAWEDVLQVNLLGSCWTIQAAAPIMARNGGGRIINIASMAAVKASPRQAHYAASKSALIAMGRTLAVELGPDNITVNAICPTIVSSPQTRGLARVSASAGGFTAPYVLPGISALRPYDVSEVVIWLASDAARLLTGLVLLLDIGSTL